MFFALINLVLALTHPTQYRAGRTALKVCKRFHTMAECASLWESVFTAIGVISNRITAPHKDCLGCLPWFDILYTVGDYDNGVLDMPGIGIQFSYAPGCLVALCGKVLRHQVRKVHGNRVCCVFYMRENVHRWLGSPPPSYSRS
ncbi:hypothetical protein CONPUDRAFT_54175 [Coniophora puteana RWD-64-598 SS2]|uniref:2OGFeDO JBP1/TET oxygenase domain-containing protein n=1 Tax=Coniophora puteana (strain RWD-64-598) TaxID=741705 RepID=A0A5M3MRY9_CONPW|nr:uncharacterized protein CONPUDRAFT_54175 [Coniophora puteana RWD-64-598 SS2]EIW81837.1 hypothetical protein CONPUDRAFT_54175 [Coniophora puteana RWD-64-598 SS2]